MIGDALGGKLGGATPTPSQTPRFGRAGFLALTQTEIALLTMKGQFIPKLSEVLARKQRSEVISAELGTGAVAPLTIQFAGGETWQFEISKLVHKDARTLADSLRGSAASV
jgi:hypothetical protein